MKKTPMPARTKPLKTKTQLSRGEGPKRKTLLRWRSRKTEAKAAERDECRQEVLLRDVPRWVEQRSDICVLHRMLRQHGDWAQCGTQFGAEPDVHEVLTRGRGGSVTDPGNCVALCRDAHDWVTTHPNGAESLGLMLPSWADDDMAADARKMRGLFEHSSTRQGQPIPYWRLKNAQWVFGAHQDLVSLGWPL